MSGELVITQYLGMENLQKANYPQGSLHLILASKFQHTAHHTILLWVILMLLRGDLQDGRHKLIVIL
jgi:hypothetical protein